MADPNPDLVLVPDLGRPWKDEALGYALEAFPDANIVLLAVVTSLEGSLSEGGVLDRDEERIESARESARESLEAVTETDPSANGRVRIETIEGRPGTVVPQYASEENVDHVVMYGHGHETSGFVRRFLGRDITTSVVERTDRPVTVLE